ncbi:hypothetical protein VTH06DRAFT_5909 [Thermothelomyces fergusii]
MRSARFGLTNAAADGGVQTYSPFAEKFGWQDANLIIHPEHCFTAARIISSDKMHQRCAPRFCVSRVVLVVDAAHLWNPLGVLGITGGCADVGGLYDRLASIGNGKADEPIVVPDSEKRIEK